MIANAVSTNTAGFAPGSLALIAINGAPDLSAATVTVASRPPVPVLKMVSTGIGLIRVPTNLPIGLASAYATINGADTPPIDVSVVANNFIVFTGPVSAGLGYETYTFGFAIIQNFVNNPHVAYRTNGVPIGFAQPAHPGYFLSIYGTGLGDATPDQVSVALAGVPVPVTYAGPAPGEPGVDQINIYLPPALTAPDSCYDGFVITVAGTQTVQSLPFTEAAATCPSPLGFNAEELAEIDGGAQLLYVQTALSSAIQPDAISAGLFLRLESAQALRLSSTYAFAPYEVIDSVLYSCQAVRTEGAFVASVALPYNGLTLTMGSSSIKIVPPDAQIQTIPFSLTGVYPPSIFQPGTWQLTAPNFSQPVQLPAPIELNAGELQSIDSTHDLTVTWDPSSYLPTSVLSVSLSASSPWFQASSISCQTTAQAGSLIIPAAQLRSLPASATLTASVLPHPDATPNFRLPQPDGSTLPLQLTYLFSETFPVTVH